MINSGKHTIPVHHGWHDVLVEAFADELHPQYVFVAEEFANASP